MYENSVAVPTGEVKRPKLRGVESIPQPLEDRLFVELLFDETITPSGIELPYEKTSFCQYSDRAVTRGRVLAVGSGKRMKKGWVRPITEVAIGDIVRFSDSCTRWVFYDNRPHAFIREDDVCWVEEGEDG